MKTTKVDLHGFAGTIEISYSKNLEMYRYKVFDITGDRFIRDYGTDPSIVSLMAKVTKLKGEWQKQLLAKK